MLRGLMLLGGVTLARAATKHLERPFHLLSRRGEEYRRESVGPLCSAAIWLRKRFWEAAEADIPLGICITREIPVAGYDSRFAGGGSQEKSGCRTTLPAEFLSGELANLNSAGPHSHAGKWRGQPQRHADVRSVTNSLAWGMDNPP